MDVDVAVQLGFIGEILDLHDALCGREGVEVGWEDIGHALDGGADLTDEVDNLDEHAVGDRAQIELVRAPTQAPDERKGEHRRHAGAGDDGEDIALALGFVAVLLQFVGGRTHLLLCAEGLDHEHGLETLLHKGAHPAVFRLHVLVHALGDGLEERGDAENQRAADDEDQRKPDVDAQQDHDDADELDDEEHKARDDGGDRRADDADIRCEAVHQLSAVVGGDIRVFLRHHGMEELGLHVHFKPRAHLEDEIARQNERDDLDDRYAEVQKSVADHVIGRSALDPCDGGVDELLREHGVVHADEGVQTVDDRQKYDIE